MTKSVSLIALLSLCACSELDNCPDEAEEVVVAEQGMTDSEALVYSSSPWEGPHAPFPAKTTMRFTHDLGVTPEVVVTYVSFEREASSLSENAGNQGLIRCVDNTDIWIKNDTCEEQFFIRVAAWASGSTDMTCPCERQFNDDCAE